MFVHYNKYYFVLHCKYFCIIANCFALQLFLHYKCFCIPNVLHCNVLYYNVFVLQNVLHCKLVCNPLQICLHCKYFYFANIAALQLFFYIAKTFALQNFNCFALYFFALQLFFALQMVLHCI